VSRRLQHAVGAPVGEAAAKVVAALRGRRTQRAGAVRREEGDEVVRPAQRAVDPHLVHGLRDVDDVGVRGAELQPQHLGPPAPPPQDRQTGLRRLRREIHSCGEHAASVGSAGAPSRVRGSASASPSGRQDGGMSDVDGGQQPGTDGQAGWYARPSQAEPLKTASYVGLLLGLVLLSVSGLSWEHVETTLGASLWWPVASLVLTVVALSWSGLAAIAHWVCASLVATRADTGA